MCNTGEYFLAEGDTFLLPSNAIYRINDKLDDVSDLSSVYSNEPESAIGDGQDADELHMDDAEFAQRLFKFEFVPHIVLWDYFGGTSCLDINCIAGDQINVLSEEFQVREVDSIISDGRTFLRLPMQWSLGRWIRNRSFQPNFGLIPSCWLIKKSFYDENKKLFINPTWFLGIADVSTAYEYLLEDRSSYKPEAKGVLDDLSSRLSSILHSPVDHQAQVELTSSKKLERQYKDANEICSEKNDIDPEHFEHASLPFYIKTYTIRRSQIGRYLLFNRQFATLYDLVYYYTNYQSAIPHKLNYGPTKKQQAVYFHSVPAPFASPTRDIYALTMKSEQWAARLYDQVLLSDNDPQFQKITEPELLSQSFSLISRSIFDPTKKSHMEFARSVQLNNNEIEEARSYIKHFPSKRCLNSSHKIPTADIVTTDEPVVKTDAAIGIDLSNLEYSAEDMLGSGAFGAVYRGKLKTVDGQKVVSHPNVTRFYGFCYDETKEYALLTFELMDIGSLAEFMKAHEYSISANECIDFLIQIARGMAHLHSLDPPIVHGDLAARNVLISHHPRDETRYILKISDFGLSKTTRHEVHFLPDDPQKMPFKWLPPEVLHRRELSTKSDVWAYAILATEIYGVIDPYGMLPNEKVLPFLKDGHRMEKPSAMPHYIYNIVLQCWRKQPVDRPTFNEIIHNLRPYYIEYESSHIIMLTSRIVADSIVNKKTVE
uniref:Protein kinase domain-containing protein n=1 Tax=Setaria digitata TaxID=48799 RepID=A0A915Q2Q4_9BILA